MYAKQSSGRRENACIVHLVSGAIRAPVTMLRTSSIRQHHRRFTAGWREFCGHVGVEIGDELLFERAGADNKLGVHVKKRQTADYTERARTAPRLLASGVGGRPKEGGPFHKIPRKRGTPFISGDPRSKTIFFRVRAQFPGQPLNAECLAHHFRAPPSFLLLKTRTASIPSLPCFFKHRRNSMVSFILTPWCLQKAANPSEKRRWYCRLDMNAS